MTNKVVIIGGGAAGPKTAAKLRRENPDIIIDMYTDMDIISYSACGLPYFVEGLIADAKQLIVRTPEQFEKQGIHVHLKQKCIEIIPDKKELIFKEVDTGYTYTVSYDILVIATGARPYIPPIENVNLKNVFTLRTIDDAINIKEAMKTAKSAAVIGGGYIGIEMLEAFLHNNLPVTMIEADKYIMGIFDEEISELIQKFLLEKEGGRLKIYTSDRVIKLIDEDGYVKKVKTLNGKEIEADLVIIATGVVPNSELIDNLNIKKGVHNSIWVNDHMKTSYSAIYAAGDCTEKTNIITHKPVWVPLGATANKEGRCAAINISGDNCRFCGILGSSVSRFFKFTMAKTGITEREAKSLGYNVVTATVTKKDKAGYMPEVNNITLKVIVDANSRSILGAQAIGCGEVNLRISTVSSAIYDGSKIENFLDVDLPYAPPYSPSIDPLINALQIIYDKLKKM